MIYLETSLNLFIGHQGGWLHVINHEGRAVLTAIPLVPRMLPGTEQVLCK